MQTDRPARTPRQIRSEWRDPARALAILALSIGVLSAYSGSARAQGAPTPTMTQPAVPSQAAPPAPPVQPAAPSASPSSSTPAAPPQLAAPAAPPQVAAPAASGTAAPSTAAPGSAAPSAGSAAPAPPAANAAPNPSAGPSAGSAPPSAGEPAIGGELLPQRLSLVGMYLDADRVVKAVMIGLAIASLVSWTVFLAKTLELGRARRQMRRCLRILVDAPTFAHAHQELRDGKAAPAKLMQAAAQEIRLSANAHGDGLKERIALQLERLELAISRKISRGTGVLATIGSTGVFVGLFGTVWGIMNSFIGISNAHTTNLAVVAPGIAQALLATAMGLIAAIPAVVIYNVLTRQTAHYRALLGDASAQIMRLVSRDLDRAKLPLAQAAE
jgi:biopolymer transport protein ExbB